MRAIPYGMAAATLGIIAAIHGGAAAANPSGPIAAADKVSVPT